MSERNFRTMPAEALGIAENLYVWRDEDEAIARYAFAEGETEGRASRDKEVADLTDERDAARLRRDEDYRRYVHDMRALEGERDEARKQASNEALTTRAQAERIKLVEANLGRRFPRFQEYFDEIARLRERVATLEAAVPTK